MSDTTTSNGAAEPAPTPPKPTPVDPADRRGGPVATAVLVSVVAAGMFAFGHYWKRETKAGVEAGAGHGASVSAADPDGAVKPLWTCSMHPQVIQHTPGVCPICHMELTPVRAGGGGGGGDLSAGQVMIDAAVVQNMGVRTAVVARGPLVQSVRAVGYLEEPEPLHRDVNLRVSGWIEKLYADVDGMAITKGQPLFDLYSPELTVAIDEMISARKQGVTAPDDATTKAIADASRRKLLQLGLEEGQVDALAKLDAAPRTVPILAPLTGHMTAKMVYEGAGVKAGDLVLRLASRHRMWIDAQVYEQQMPLISDGQPVRATLVAQPGKTFEGKVLFVHPHLDPATRTATVRIEIPNEDHTLRQGMYATVEILADAYHEAIVVPREAVIDTGRRQIAFVDLGGGKFEPRELKVGQAGQDGTVQVLAGLKEGETVVTSGQFLLDSESRLREAVAKFAAGGAGLVAVTPTTAPAAAASVPAAAVVVPHTDEVVLAYLDLARRFGARQENATPVDPAPLAAAAKRAAEQAAGDGAKLARAVADAAGAMSGKPIEAQREAFVALSEAVVALAKRSRPTAAVGGEKLFVFTCPMAFDDKGASWLQTDDKIANPFYAVEMKRCGSMTDTLELAK